MADNETSYLPIGTCLEQIEKAVYGREVRQAIHDGIAQCYDDTVEGVNAAQQAASDTQDVIDNAVAATNRANTAATEASNVKVEQTVSGDTVTFTTTKRDGTTVSTSFQKPNIVVSKDEGSGEFSVTAKGWNGEEITAKIPDPSEEVKSRANIAAVSKVKTALGNPLTITDGMDAPAVKTVVTLEPKQDLHGYDHPWVGGAGKNLLPIEDSVTISNITFTKDANGYVTASPSNSDPRQQGYLAAQCKFHLTAGAYKLIADVSIAATNSNNTLVLYDDSNNQISLTAGYNIFTNAGLKVRDFSLDNDTNVGLLFKIYDGSARFMIVKSTETDYTYEPYSNICPIEGYDTVRVTATGKNLYTGALKILSHSIDVSGTYNYDSNGCVTEYIPVKGADVIKWGIEVYPVSGRGRRLHAYDQYGNWLRQLDFFTSVNDGNRLRTVTLTEDVAYVRLSLYVDDVYVFIYTDQSITGFIKDEGSTTSLSIAQAAGATVYGGTVTLNEDGSGTLVVDKGYVDLGSLAWTKNETSGNTFYQAGDVAATIKRPAATDVAIPLVSDLFKATYAGASFYHYAEGISVHTNGTLRLYYASQPATESELKTFLSGHQLIYPLAAGSTTYTITASQLRTLTGKNYVWTDGTKLELTYRADKYADVEKFLNAIPTGTKTGDPAVFADGADDLPFDKLTIAVEPHQEGSGDPSPDNVRPITGWDEVKATRCGKNLFPGIIAKRTLDDTTGEEMSTTSNSITTYIPAVYNTVYVLTPATGTASGAVRIFEYDKNLSFLGCSQVPSFTINSRLIINPANANTKYIRLRAGSGVLVPDVDYQLEEGSNSTVYEPYTSTSLPISLKYATGSTVYGGTVTINRDGTGSVVVDRAYIEMSGFQYESGETRFWYANVPTPYGATVSRTGSFVCDKYIAVTDGRAISGVTTGMCYFGAQKSNGNCDFYVHDTRYTDATTFNAAVGLVSIAYKLATPTTYTLTAPQLTSLLGNNTVWCDAGQVTVKYKRDIGKALDAMVASLIEAGLYVDMGGADVVPGA